MKTRIEFESSDLDYEGNYKHYVLKHIAELVVLDFALAKLVDGEKFDRAVCTMLSLEAEGIVSFELKPEDEAEFHKNVAQMKAKRTADLRPTASILSMGEDKVGLLGTPGEILTTVMDSNQSFDTVPAAVIMEAKRLGEWTPEMEAWLTNPIRPGKPS